MSDCFLYSITISEIHQNNDYNQKGIKIWNFFCTFKNIAILSSSFDMKCNRYLVSL